MGHVPLVIWILSAQKGDSQLAEPPHTGTTTGCPVFVGWSLGSPVQAVMMSLEICWLDEAGNHPKMAARFRVW